MFLAGIPFKFEFFVEKWWISSKPVFRKNLNCPPSQLHLSLRNRKKSKYHALDPSFKEDTERSKSSIDQMHNTIEESNRIQVTKTNFDTFLQIV